MSHFEKFLFQINTLELRCINAPSAILNAKNIYFQNVELRQNVREGIIMGNQSLGKQQDDITK